MVTNRKIYKVRFSIICMRKIMRQSLILPEWALKAASTPGAAVAAGSEKGLVGMVSDGIISLPGALRNIYNTSKTVYNANKDLDNMSAREYLSIYGTKAQEYANDVMEFLRQFGENIVERPVETAIAATLAGASLYLGGAAFKFYRQKGQGGIFTKWQRKRGNKFWPETR